MTRPDFSKDWGAAAVLVAGIVLALYVWGVR